MSGAPPPPRRILVIMLRRIGDVILTLPAVGALCELYPEAAIDFLVESPADQLLAGHPDISSVLHYQGGLNNYIYWLWRVRSERYDWVIDYMGNPRSAMLAFCSRAPLRAGPGHVSHRWAYSHPLQQSPKPCYSALEKVRVLRSLGLNPRETAALPRLEPAAASEAFAGAALEKLGLGGYRARTSAPTGCPLIGLVPASRRVTRRWPARSFAAVGAKLRDNHNADILIFWGPGERALAAEVRGGIGPRAFLAPETDNLNDLAALIGRCRLIVANCNGPKHIAVARGVPTVTIHGASNPRSWTPAGDPRHRAVRLEELDCIGCGLNSCPKSLECLRDLAPETVYRTAAQLLEEEDAHR